MGPVWSHATVEGRVAEYILVADDDPTQTDLIELYLRREGFEVEVVHDGAEAIASAAARRPDAIVLDVMMPGVDGLEVCRQLAGEQGIPVVMLTARSTENDLLLGLYLGADDYLTKPFSPRELVARVRTILRRARRTQPSDAGEIVVGGVTVRPLHHEVFVDGVAVELTRVEFEMLLTLAEREDLVESRRQLLESLHGDANYLTERTIDTHVMNLRRKLETDPTHPQRLVTVYGVGYKLVSGRSLPPSAGR
jgi:DNA-binding response OmpR family regulator